MKRCLAPLALCLLAAVCMLAVPSHFVKKVEAVCPTCPPPPPPPPTVGEFGGPLAGLSTTITNLFNGGYGTFVIKWDPIRGLGPVSTKTGCFTCHGAGTDVLTGTAGDTSNVTGTRYGKWNSDNTFNYLDGNGTFPENEGGPIVHGISNATFQTLPGCNQMTIASNGATESGTTVTITTTAAHGFQKGQEVQILNVPVSGYNGTFAIVSVPSTTTFTYTAKSSGLAASGGGAAQNLPHEVVPADATVVSNVRSPQLFGLGLIDNIPDASITANVGISKKYGITGIANMVRGRKWSGASRKIRSEAGCCFAVPIQRERRIQRTGYHHQQQPLRRVKSFNPNEHLPQGLSLSDELSAGQEQSTGRCPGQHDQDDPVRGPACTDTSESADLADNRGRSGFRKYRLQHLPHREFHHAAERDAQNDERQ